MTRRKRQKQPSISLVGAGVVGATLATLLAKERYRVLSVIGRNGPAAVALAFKGLTSPDAGVRSAARIALEHQNPAQWRERAVAEMEPQASILALVALLQFFFLERRVHYQ